MSYLPQYVQVMRVFEQWTGCKRAVEPWNPEDCYNYTIFCKNQTERQDLAKRLQPFILPWINFNVHEPIKRTKDEQGTHWALFEGPGNKPEIEILYSLIEECKNFGGCSCCKHLITHMRRWKETAYHVFHLAIRCNPRMVTMVKRLFTNGDAELMPGEPEWHDLMNAAGEPIVYIATRMGKLEVVRHLLSQKPEVMNAKVGASAYTLLHVVANTEHRSIIQYLMSGDRTPQIDYSARDLHGCSPLEHAFEGSSLTATAIYDLIPLQDRSHLDGYRLLSRIINHINNDVDYKLTVAKQIIDDLTLLPTNTSSSPYNAALDSYVDPVDEQEKDAAKQMWKLLMDRAVPIGGYDLHGSTPIARTVEHAPPEFLLDLLNSAEERIKLNKEHLNWLSVDKDGDTPRDIAKRRIDASILGIVEKGIRRQNDAKSLEHFIAKQDYESMVGIYFALGNFERCLDYLDLLGFSEWRQCTKARCYLRLGRRQEALTSLAGLRRCCVVLRLESSIFDEGKDRTRALRMNRAAYQAETRRNEKIALQRELLSMCLSLHEPAADLPTELTELICKHVTEP